MREGMLQNNHVSDLDEFDDLLEQHQQWQEDMHWGGNEPDLSSIDLTKVACLNEIVVDEHDYLALISERDQLQEKVKTYLKQIQELQWTLLGFGMEYPPGDWDSFNSFTDLSGN
jgi:hypothetical protein